MLINRRRFALIAGSGALAACTPKPTPELPRYADAKPAMVPEEVFNGRLSAWGTIHDMKGDLIRRMWADLQGTWDSENLTIKETMRFEDDVEMGRTWLYAKTGPNEWTGRIEGSDEVSVGKVSGNLFHRTYRANAMMPNGEVRADFDEWMWRLDETRLVCQAYISRFGIGLARAAVFLERA